MFAKIANFFEQAVLFVLKKCKCTKMIQQRNLNLCEKVG